MKRAKKEARERRTPRRFAMFRCSCRLWGGDAGQERFGHSLQATKQDCFARETSSPQVGCYKGWAANGRRLKPSELMR